MGSFRRTQGSRRLGAALLVAGLVTGVMGLAAAPTGAADGEPTVVLQDGVNGCNGVRTTPGSENTDKKLVGGTLEPGGTAIFEITYPVDPSDVSGRTEFEITDCVFVNDVAVQKYKVTFVPNTEFFVLRISLVVPQDTPLGADYCNYAKTTAAPSQSQASNRKAGPACFRVGGSLRVEKVDAADGETLLAGARFRVECVPTVQQPPVVIEGVEQDTFEGIVDDGVIVIHGPELTPCTITELAPPPGYELATPTVVATAIPRIDGEVVTVTFANPATVPTTTTSTTTTSTTTTSTTTTSTTVPEPTTTTTAPEPTTTTVPEPTTTTAPPPPPQQTTTTAPPAAPTTTTSTSTTVPSTTTSTAVVEGFQIEPTTTVAASPVTTAAVRGVTLARTGASDGILVLSGFLLFAGGLTSMVGVPQTVARRDR